jgi:hypothetical protein
MNPNRTAAVSGTSAALMLTAGVMPGVLVARLDLVLQPCVSHVAHAVAPAPSTNRRLERFAILLNSLLNQGTFQRMFLRKFVSDSVVESALNI